MSQGSGARVTDVETNATLIRRFLDNLPFALSMTIDSVVLMDPTSTGAIEDLEISSIYYDFVTDGIWVAARHAWALML